MSPARRHAPAGWPPSPRNGWPASSESALWLLPGVVPEEGEDRGQEAQFRLRPATLPIQEARLRAADFARYFPLPEVPVQAHPAQVLAQGFGVVRVAGPRFPSPQGHPAAWQLMHATLGLRALGRP